MASGNQLLWGMMLLDLLLAFSAYTLGISSVYGTPGQSWGGQYLLIKELRTSFSQGDFFLLLVLSLTWMFTAHSMGLYRSRRFLSRNREYWDITKVAMLTTSTGIIGTTFLPTILSTPLVLWLFCFWVIFFQITCRSSIRFILRSIRTHGLNVKHVLIAGRNPRARGLARHFEEHPELGYRLLGFADDENADNSTDVITDLKGLPSYLWENVVHEVILCLPVRSFYDEAQSILDVCERQGVLVRVVNDLFTSRLGYVSTDLLHSHSMLTFSVTKMNGWQTYFKRIFDVIVSGVGLIVLFPVFVAISLIIKSTNPGPIFFAQERLGKGKRRFNMLKFRTMVMGADKLQRELEHLNEADGAAFKIKNDPRVTKVGKILRTSSLDELPQLINVFKGDMSLVGPRPLPVRDFTNMDKDFHLRRFSVLPGMTCLWQVEARSFKSFNRWMELDMLYIDNWSLWLDFKILLKTIPAVLRRTGAV